MRNPPPFRAPHAYFLTFHPYGNWLPGDARGWTPRGRGSRRLPPAPSLEAHYAKRLRYPVVVLSPRERDVVRTAITETCEHRRWCLRSLVIESDHVHVIVSAPTRPEKVLQDLKSWATRHLRAHGYLVEHPHPWAEHGSTRYLFDEWSLRRAIDYVLDDHHVDARDL